MPTTSQPAVSSLLTIDLDTVDTAQLAQALAHQPRPQLLIDCGDLQTLRTRGVSHVVSQLLMLRHTGASMWLSNVNPLLHRCLHVLKLDAFFLISEA